MQSIMGKHAFIYTQRKIQFNQTITRKTVTNMVKVHLKCHRQTTIIIILL